MYQRRVFQSIIILWLTVQVFGCAWFQPKEEKTARDLAEEGMKAYEDNDFRNSLETFQKLRDWYPFSKYALLADLKVGDAHYNLKEYDEAISAYEEFENLHPKNEAVPYVVYQTGRCYLDRLEVIDRDQTLALQAVQIFSRLIRTYPDSPFAKKAEEHIRTCYRNLAEHDFYVGMFYYKTKHYKAAMERFKMVLRSYPDLGVHYKALQYIALCQTIIENPAGVAK